MPALPLRAIQARITKMPAGSEPKAIEAWLEKDAKSDRGVLQQLYGKASSRRPKNLDKLLEDLRSSDSKIGWAAVDEFGKVGAAAIPDLVYLMDFGGQPADFRAAAALGQIGAAAKAALPDLRRSTLRGGTTEHEGLLSRKALEAISKIE